MDWILQNNIIAYLVTAILGAFGSKIFFTKKFDFLNHLLMEITQLLTVLVDSLKPDSDGNVRITPEEAERIRKEITELLKLFRPK
jgi:hypothetical protein